MIRLLCILLCLNLTLLFSQAKNDTIASSTTSNPNPPLLSPSLPENSNSNQNQTKPLLKPSIHIIVGAIISAFSITFLIFLYIKHCKTANNAYPNTSRTNLDPYTHRKNSGIDPNIIDLLPVFRFSSLKGQKDGLECAVCLTNYEPSEVLRLLPKCKHAFHVECADTWLNSHSTCPLCRYRVDPEDIFLIEHNTTLSVARQDQSQLNHDQEFVVGFHQSPGRHSSAGEGRSSYRNVYLQITVQKPMASRRSLDSSMKSKKVESASIGCFEKSRKDELLLAGKENKLERRIEHQIVVSSDTNQQIWSDVQPSNMLYIRSEMLMTDSRRVLAASEKNDKRRGDEEITENGRRVLDKRSVSEIMSRKRSTEMQQQRQEGFVSRWLAWISDTSNYTPPPTPVSQSSST